MQQIKKIEKKIFILECILCIEMNKKFLYKIVRKTDIKNVTKFFFN